MARPRKPTHLLSITGGLDHNPGRYADRANEPQDDRDLGAPPPHLVPSQQAIWREIEQLSPPGVLRHADRLIVELAAVLLAQFRRAGELMPLPAMTRLQSLLAELGMTPAARSKVTAAAAKPQAGKFAGIGKRPEPPARPPGKRS
jgi:phage terminase small subunit